MGEITFIGGKLTVQPGTEGVPTDWWYYEDLRRPLLRLDAAVGVPRDEVTITGVTYDDMRPGSYQVKPRLEDMDVNHIEASLCFPTFPRFCGQTFTEAQDKELALLCVQAYNDWMVEEWCGESGGRLIPLCLIPLWDAALAADEVRRNAARGVRAVCFSEIPPFLGLPVGARPRQLLGPVLRGLRRDRHRDQHAHRLVVEDALHLGRRPAGGGVDAHPHQRHVLVGRLLVLRGAGALPHLELAYSEGQIGWIPYILERADKVWEENRGWGGVADKVPDPPSTYFRRQIYGCFFDDAHGLRSVDEIGVDNITYESDYPHSDSTWPHTKEIAERQMAHLDDDTAPQDRPGQRHQALRARPGAWRPA